MLCTSAGRVAISGIAGDFFFGKLTGLTKHDAQVSETQAASEAGIGGWQWTTANLSLFNYEKV